VIADFKHMRDVQYVTDETVEKIISVISAIRSIEEKYSESIIKTLTANDEADPGGSSGLLKGTRIIVPSQDVSNKKGGCCG
jgi:Ras-related protein Rab-11A